MNWIPYVSMAGRAKENLSGGSLKYLFVYLKSVYLNVVTVVAYLVYSTWLWSTFYLYNSDLIVSESITIKQNHAYNV